MSPIAYVIFWCLFLNGAWKLGRKLLWWARHPIQRWRHRW